MAIIPAWNNNEKTIILVEFTGEWIWTDFAPVRQTIVEMVSSVSHKVDFIADFRTMDRMPSGTLAVGRSLRNSTIPNEGVVVLVGSSPILRMLYQSFILAFPSSRKNFMLVPTLDEAYRVIAQIKQNRDNKH